jgi:hypothetical protein
MHIPSFLTSVLLHIYPGVAFDISGGLSFSSHTIVDNPETPQVSVDSIPTDDSELANSEGVLEAGLSADLSSSVSHSSGAPADNVFEMRSAVEREARFTESLISFYHNMQHVGYGAVHAAALIIVFSSYMDLKSAIEEDKNEISRNQEVTTFLIQSTLQSLSRLITPSPSLTIEHTHSLHINLGNAQPRSRSLLQYALGRGNTIKRRSMHLSVNGSVRGLGNIFKNPSEGYTSATES